VFSHPYAMKSPLLLSLFLSLRSEAVAIGPFPMSRYNLLGHVGRLPFSSNGRWSLSCRLVEAHSLFFFTLTPHAELRFFLEFFLGEGLKYPFPGKIVKRV